MFCTNCGKELIGTPEICLGCGAKPLAGTSFCQGCGAPVDPLAEICAKCGTRLAKAVSPAGRAWMPTTAGILSIITGVIGLFAGIAVAAIGRMIGMAWMYEWWYDWWYEWWVVGAPLIGFWIASIILIVIGIVAIIGGSFALRKKVWGMALAGAICSLFLVWVLAIPAIVFIAVSKREFK